MRTSVDVVVAGGGGFIGGHLVGALLAAGPDRPRRRRQAARGVVPGPPGRRERASPTCRSLGRRAVAPPPVRGTVYMLAADMGGMGFIENNKAACMLTRAHQHPHAAGRARPGVERYFYASSACVYAAGKQTDPDVTALREADAYPAMPEDGYGWEKLFSERMCRHFLEDFGLDDAGGALPQRLRPARHVDGRPGEGAGRDLPQGGEAELTGEHELEIWGDGEQTRSFMYIDDCVAGHPDDPATATSPEPVNLGSSELVSINGLVDIVEQHRRHPLRAPLRARRAPGCPRPQQRQHPDPRDLRLGARRPGWSTASSGPTPGSTTRSSARWADRRAMRILVHDYSGHPFQAELSAALARRGHQVDPLVVRGLRLRQGPPRRTTARASPSSRSAPGRSWPRRTSRAGWSRSCGTASSWSAQVRRRRPDVVMVANAPIPTLVVLAGVPLAGAGAVGAVAPGRPGRRGRVVRGREAAAGLPAGRPCARRGRAVVRAAVGCGRGDLRRVPAHAPRVGHGGPGPR